MIGTISDYTNNHTAVPTFEWDGGDGYYEYTTRTRTHYILINK
jgi:hypothetical protein